MRAIPFETAQYWIERLASLPAPVRMEDIPGLAVEFGWQPTKFESRYMYEEGGETRVVLTPFDDETGEIFSFSVDLVRNWRDDLAGNVAVADFFPRYVEAACGVWGEPWSVMTDITEFIWKIHEQAYAEIGAWRDSVSCRFRKFDGTEERW
ncbi:MAG: DUF6301 family protein [Propionibacteriaceae bacterium]|nr:DUF6301 family protein [Propionibacteriaceae bacterium]